MPIKNAAIKKQIDAIKPGENYPSCVEVQETKGKREKFQFLLNSFYVGMYCAVHLNDDRMPLVQTGDYDNKKFVRGLKKDLFKAVDRGAVVIIGPLRPCKLTMD